jgi:hypothetical protein
MCLALYWLHTRGQLREAALIFACPPSTCSRYIRKWVFLMAEHLPTIPAAAVRWPSAQKISQYADLIDHKYPGMAEQLGRKAFCFMDGCNFEIQDHGDLYVQRNYYNAYDGHAKVGNLFIWAPDGKIIFCKLNNTGVQHDSMIAAQAYHLVEDRTPAGFGILADSAFPNLGGKIIKPLKISQVITADIEAQLRSRTVSAMRVPCEWGNRGLQACFPRVTVPLPVEHEWRKAIIVACVHLLNFRTAKMGQSQIQSCFRKDYQRWRDLFDDSPSNLDKYLEVAIAARERRESEAQRRQG